MNEEVEDNTPIHGPPCDPAELFERVLAEAKADGLHVATALSSLVIAVRHRLQHADKPPLEFVRLAAKACAVPVLEAGGSFWWPPARGETWHPTAEEFLSHVRASRQDHRPEGAKESSDG